jgi:hypothetical protein
MLKKIQNDCSFATFVNRHFWFVVDFIDKAQILKSAQSFWKRATLITQNLSKVNAMYFKA